MNNNFSVLWVLIFFVVFALAGARANQEMNDKKIDFKQYVWSKKWNLTMALVFILGTWGYIFYKVQQHEKLRQQEVSTVQNVNASHPEPK